MFIRKFLKSRFFIPFIFLVITCLFFCKAVLFGQVPFPGDLLISEYSPWKYESYLGYNPGSYPNKAQYFDVISQLYPWKNLAIEQLKSGNLPFWNPYNFSGTPLLANNQSGVFYPLNIVFFMFPFVNAWSVYIILQPILSLFFTYFYLRSINLSKPASLFGSIAFSFSLFMTVFLEYGNIGHSLIWLPLVLLGIEKSIKKISTYSFLIMLGLIASAFAGHLQIFSYVLLFSLFYLTVRFFQEIDTTVFFKILLLFILSLGVTSIQLFPTFELINNSARVAHDFNSFVNNLLLQPEQLILLLSPDLFGNPVTRNYLLPDSYPGNAIYVGLSAFLLSIFSLYRWKENLVKFYLVAILVVLLFTVRIPFSEIFYSQNLPLLSSSSPSNGLFLLSFSLSVLSAFGLESLLRAKKVKDLMPILVVGFIIFLTWSLKLFGFDFSEKNFLLSSGLFVLVSVVIFLLIFLRKRIVLLLLIPILVFDLLFYFLRFNPFVPPSLIYPPSSIDKFLQQEIGYERYIGHKAATIESNFSTQLRTYSPNGYDPLYLKNYSLFTNASRSDVQLGLESSKQLDVLSVRFVLDRVENGSDENTFPPDRFRSIYSQNGWIIYENTQATPRTYIIGDEGKVPARITNYSPNKIEIEKDRGAGMLVLTDNFYPGWQATIDNIPTEVVSHGVFRAVNVKDSDKKIVFEYTSESFYLGAKVTIISILGLVILFGYIKYGIYKKV